MGNNTNTHLFERAHIWFYGFGVHIYNAKDIPNQDDQAKSTVYY